MDQETVKTLYALFRNYYDHTSWEAFCADLTTKHYVVLLTNPHGEIRGFSTLEVFSFHHGGRFGRGIFSGDTIIHPEDWGQQALAKTWLSLAAQLHAEAPHDPWYWLLIAKGHRIYRLLSLFSKEFHPHWERPTPQATQDLMDDLAAQRFGHYYDRASGVVRFDLSRGQLIPSLADVPAKDMEKPAVRYFLERNPGYRQGDELVCLAPIRPENLTSLPRGLFHPGPEA